VKIPSNYFTQSTAVRVSFSVAGAAGAGAGW